MKEKSEGASGAPRGGGRSRGEAEVLARVEKRFARFGEDEIMKALKEASQRFLLRRLKVNRD